MSDDEMSEIWDRGRRQYVIECLARNEFPYQNWDKHYPDLAAERLRQVAKNPNLGCDD